MGRGLLWMENLATNGRTLSIMAPLVKGLVVALILTMDIYIYIYIYI